MEKSRTTANDERNNIRKENVRHDADLHSQAREVASSIMRARSHRFDARAVALLIVKKIFQNATKHMFVSRRVSVRPPSPCGRGRDRGRTDTLGRTLDRA